MNSPFPLVSELPSVTKEPDNPIGRMARVQLEAAREQGLNEGRALGFEQGYKEGLEKGLEDGYREGHRQGEQTGQQAAVTAARNEIAGAIAGLNSAIQFLGAKDAASLKDVEADVVNLAVKIAEVIMEREVCNADNPGRDALVRALSLIPLRGEVIVRLNPADLDAVGPVDDLLPGREVTFISDLSISSGGAVVEVGDARIDAEIPSALERIRVMLAGDSTTPYMGEVE